MIDEFYIGHEATMPARMARRVRGAALALLALGLTIPLLLLAVQGRFSTGRFEYGTTRTFEGRLVEFPYPALDVVGTGTARRSTGWWARVNTERPISCAASTDAWCACRAPSSSVTATQCCRSRPAA